MPWNFNLQKIEIKNIMNPAPRVPKSLVVFLAAVQLFLGFNLGFIKHMNILKMPAHCYSITSGVILSSCLAVNCFTDMSWLIFLNQYLFTFIILLFSKYTLYDFLLDFATLKGTTQKDFVANVGFITWMYFFFTYCWKFAIGFLYHWNIASKTPLYLRLLALISLLGLDVLPVAIFLVFYHIYAKLNHLAHDMRSGELDLIGVQATYKDVVGISDKIKPMVDNLIVLGFLSDCPKWILTIWRQLIFLKSSEYWLVQGCSYAYALHLTLQICVPAVAAELANARAEDIYGLLQEKLLTETDLTKCESLSRLSRYVRARPPLRAAWRLLPPGLRLPTAMLSMCATYLVVVIQFTHLYD